MRNKKLMHHYNVKAEHVVSIIAVNVTLYEHVPSAVELMSKGKCIKLCLVIMTI